MSYERTYWHDLKNLTVTGESTRCTFDSSTRISRAFEHNAFTSDSFMISQRLSCSIWRSKSLISVRNCLNFVAEKDFLNASFDFFSVTESQPIKVLTTQNLSKIFKKRLSYKWRLLWIKYLICVCIIIILIFNCTK